MGITILFMTYDILYGWFMSFVFKLNNAARILYNNLHVDRRIYHIIPMDDLSLLTPVYAEISSIFSPVLISCPVNLLTSVLSDGYSLSKLAA